jgi:hypothetical protein
MLVKDQAVMCGSVPAIVRCPEPDGDGKVIVALQRRGGFFYADVLPSSLTVPIEQVIDGVVYVVDIAGGTIRPKEG